MDLTEAVGIGAGILTAVSMIPQLVKMVRERKAANVSVVMFVVLLAGLALWTLYGVLKEDLPIIATNSFSFMVSVLNIFFTLKYKKQNEG